MLTLYYTDLGIFPEAKRQSDEALEWFQSYKGKVQCILATKIPKEETLEMKRWNCCVPFVVVGDDFAVPWKEAKEFMTLQREWEFIPKRELDS